MNPDLLAEALKKLAAVHDNLQAIENVYCEENCDLDASDGINSLAEAVTLLQLAATLSTDTKNEDNRTP